MKKISFSQILQNSIDKQNKRSKANKEAMLAATKRLTDLVPNKEKNDPFEAIRRHNEIMQNIINKKSLTS